MGKETVSCFGVKIVEDKAIPKGMVFIVGSGEEKEMLLTVLTEKVIFKVGKFELIKRGSLEICSKGGSRCR